MILDYFIVQFRCMKIYHGSKKIIEKPSLKGSNPTNDYGPAFYLTTELDAAKSWACRNDIVGVVSKYDINEKTLSNLKILDLTNKDKYTVLNWIAILMHFRSLDSTFIANNQLALNWLSKYYINVDDYDVIVGFRADDAYFRFPTRFVSNDLAFEDLDEVFLYGNLGVQYAFISKAAINSLKFDGYIECDDTFVGHYYNIVKEASKKFNVLTNKPRDPQKTYILDLMRRDNGK